MTVKQRRRRKTRICMAAMTLSCGARHGKGKPGRRKPVEDIHQTERRAFQGQVRGYIHSIRTVQPQGPGPQGCFGHLEQHVRGQVDRHMVREQSTCTEYSYQKNSSCKYRERRLGLPWQESDLSQRNGIERKALSLHGGPPDSLLW
jgi:hypothetical protein